MSSRYGVETRGCPKNEAASDKLGRTLGAGGFTWGSTAEAAGLVVANTCVTAAG